jgi:hypothetical protein
LAFKQTSSRPLIHRSRRWVELTVSSACSTRTRTHASSVRDLQHSAGDSQFHFNLCSFCPLEQSTRLNLLSCFHVRISKLKGKKICHDHASSPRLVYILREHEKRNRRGWIILGAQATTFLITLHLSGGEELTLADFSISFCFLFPRSTFCPFVPKRLK